MKKLLFAIVFLMLVILPFTTLAVHAKESIYWEYGDDNLCRFVTSDTTMPQLTGYFYLSDRYTEELVYVEELYTGYYLHLAIGVIGEEPAENIQVHFEAIGSDPIYENVIEVQAIIDADNYDPVTVNNKFVFYYDDNCGIALGEPVRLVRDRTDFVSGTILTLDDAEGSIPISGIDGHIEPGPENICEIVIPCSFFNEPPIFTEANQPPQARFNVITDNPVIGDEATNSVWLTDEAGNLVSSLAADHIYTVHFYVRVSGPEAVTGATIRSNVIDNRTAYDFWGLSARVRSNEARDFIYDVKYPVQTNLELYYIEGSLLLHCEGQEDIALNPAAFFQDSFRADGVKIGTAGLDGVINPGLESACEITYQFSTIGLDAKEETERAAVEATKEVEDARKAEEAEVVEDITAFSDNCSVWVTDEKGNEVKSFAADCIYTIHASIRINGTEQAQGVKISSSDLGALTLDESARNLYLKLMAEGLENNTMALSVRRVRSTEEVLALEYVKGSLQANSAVGTYSLSDKDFFNYETGCLVGLSGADGVIPAGKESAVEITYQVKAVADSSKFKSSSDGFLRSPVTVVSLAIAAALELVIIIWMAHHPDNRFSRRVERKRRFWKTVMDGYAKARADLRAGDNPKTSVPTDVGDEKEVTRNDQ